MNFYVFIKVQRGGGALVHIYMHVWEHKVSLNYRIA